eukprot:s702_g51.t1
MVPGDLSLRVSAQWPVGVTEEVANRGERLRTHAAVLQQLRVLLRSKPNWASSGWFSTWGEHCDIWAQCFIEPFQTEIQRGGNVSTIGHTTIWRGFELQEH